MHDPTLSYGQAYRGEDAVPNRRTVVLHIYCAVAADASWPKADVESANVPLQLLRLTGQVMSIVSNLKALFEDIDRGSKLEANDLRAYNEQYGWLAPSLPAGNGRHIRLSSVGLGAVERICATMRANDAHLLAAYSLEDMIRLLHITVGRLLMSDTPSGTAFEIPGDAVAFKKKLTGSIRAEASRLPAKETHAFGVKVFSGSPEVCSITLGPIWLGPRETWLEEVRIDDALDQSAKQRIARCWKCKTPRERQSYRFFDEQDILDATGEHPWVCTVDLSGHAIQRSREKAILAARIALAAVALCWEHPTRAAKNMGLSIDGRGYGYTTMTYNEKGPLGVWREKRLRMGAVIFTEDARTFAKDYRNHFAVVGDILRSFLAVLPDGPMSELSAKLCRALTWFWEACNAPLDFMAITKFATSIDVLCEGQDEYALCALIKKCADLPSDHTLLRDGTSVEALVHEVYTTGRSKFVHGARPSLVEDLASPRRRAEMLASLTPKSYISWVGSSDDQSNIGKGCAA